MEIFSSLKAWKIVTFLGYNDWIDVKIGLQLNKIFVFQKIFKNLCQI